MLNAEIAIIGGTGVYNAEMLVGSRDVEIKTRYGKVDLLIGSYKGKEVAFLTRHGKGHAIPPHLVNYRANIQALKDLGVKKIIATAAVGSLREEMAPRDFVFLDQFLDFTKARKNTFFEGDLEGVRHVDFTEPYCPKLRAFLYDQAVSLGIRTHQAGCYACMEGPRFETPAEIQMLKLLGGDVVGMTNVPEVVLAREAGICYATIAMVTNYAAGIASEKLSHTEVVQVMQELSGNISRLIMVALAGLSMVGDCACCR